MEVVNLREQRQFKEKAIEYFQQIWANDDSKPLYEDCIARSLETKSPLPRMLMDGFPSMNT